MMTFSHHMCERTTIEARVEFALGCLFGDDETLRLAAHRWFLMLELPAELHHTVDDNTPLSRLERLNAASNDFCGEGMEH